MWRGRSVAVVVPAYNEARLVARMLSRVPAYVDAIFVVDDASRDETGKAARAAGDPRVRILRHAENRGVGAAIATGYERALEEGFELLVVMAADDQMDPEDLPALLEEIASGRAAYAKGNRFVHPESGRMPRSRRFAGKALSALTRATTGLGVDDSQCGYTALSSDAARKLPLAKLWPRYGYPNDLLGLLAERGCSVADVPVRPVYADESSGIRPWHAAIVAGVIMRRWWLTGRRPCRQR